VITNTSRDPYTRSSDDTAHSSPRLRRTRCHGRLAGPRGRGRLTRVSQINGCGVCLAGHTKSARKEGETDERLDTLAAWREVPYFNEDERAALDLAESATRMADQTDPVPDAVWDEAARHFDEIQLATLVLAIANINVWNRLNVATRQPVGEW